VEQVLDASRDHLRRGGGGARSDHRNVNTNARAVVLANAAATLGGAAHSNSDHRNGKRVFGSDRDHPGCVVVAEGGAIEARYRM
jgi:hypothetical protein